MEIERYLDFIISEIPKKKTITLRYINQPHTKFNFATTVVSIEIIEKYTRSVKLKLLFDKYIVEELFFISRHFGPEHIFSKIDNKISNLVNNIFINDCRSDEIKEKYDNYFKNINLPIKNNE